MKHILQQLKVCLLFSILIFVTTALSQPRMYWSEDSKIRRANLDGTNIEDILTIFTSGFAGSDDIDIDNVGGKIYWTNSIAGKIQSADLNGNNLVDILTGLSSPNYIALDANGGKVYWTSYDFNSFTGKIHRANLDGSNIENLVDNASTTGLALDLIGGKMYWMTIQPGEIKRADLDGSNVELLLQTGQTGGIALDIPGGKMYFTEWGVDPGISRANLDGSNWEILVDNSTATLERPWDIALDLPAGKMYWTDLIADKIQRANLDGSNVEDVISSGLNAPGYISILPAPTAVDEDVTTIPNQYVLKQNFPNPFNPSTTIKFSIPSKSFTTLKVYDILGNEIAELVNEQLAAGNYKFNFTANNLSSGIYFYRITSGSFIAVKKMTLMK